MSWSIPGRGRTSSGACTTSPASPLSSSASAAPGPLASAAHAADFVFGVATLHLLFRRRGAFRARRGRIVGALRLWRLAAGLVFLRLWRLAAGAAPGFTAADAFMLARKPMFPLLQASSAPSLIDPLIDQSKQKMPNPK
jgi:hypothetical protein